MARALAFLALQKASEAEITTIGQALDSLAGGKSLNEVLDGLHLDATARKAAEGFIALNPAIVEWLKRGDSLS
jgi:hypothetical protein